MDEPILLTVEEVQRVTGLGRTTVYGLIRTGELPSVRIGRAVRVRLETLKQWIAEREDVRAVGALQQSRTN